MREIFIALISSSLTVVITSFFNYHFLIRKELRMQANAYKIEILQKIYTPIVKVMMDDLHPGDGYEGITISSFSTIEDIVKKNYEIVSPELDRIIWSIREDIIHQSQNRTQDNYNEFLNNLDENRESYWIMLIIISIIIKKNWVYHMINSCWLF